MSSPSPTSTLHDSPPARLVFTDEREPTEQDRDSGSDIIGHKQGLLLANKPAEEEHELPSSHTEDEARALAKRAFAHAQAGDHDKAAKKYADALEVVPEEAKALHMALLNHRATANYNLGRFGEAIADYTASIAIAPNEAAYFNRGNAYIKKAGFTQAIDDFTQIIVSNHNHTGAYNNRGCAYLRNEDFAKALADFTKAIQTSPRAAELYHNRCCAYIGNGNYAKAWADFAKAVEISPNDEELHRRMRVQINIFLAGLSSSPLAELAALQRPFQYVADSSPAELAGNLERAIKSITVKTGTMPDRNRQAALDLCTALNVFLQPFPSEERVEAFWGVFKPMVAFLKQADTGGSKPSANQGKQTLVEAASMPAGKLCGMLFRAHRNAPEWGLDMDQRLLDCLETALSEYAGAGGYSSSMGATISLMAKNARLLCSIDTDWTAAHLFPYLSEDSPYRRNAANALVYSMSPQVPGFLSGIQEHFLKTLADLESVFPERDDRIRACKLLCQIANEALLSDDRNTIAKLAETLKALPETERGDCIFILQDSFEELDDTGHSNSLLDKHLAAQFIKKIFPVEKEFQSERTTMGFVELALAANGHASDIYEACQELLVPLTDKRDQYHIHWKLTQDNQSAHLIEKHPEVVIGIIGKTTARNSRYAKKLRKLGKQLSSQLNN